MKTERFEMRLDEAVLESVDAWRARQDDAPSRAEAMRRLIEVGLSASPERNVRLSEGEKLISLMLCEVYKHLKVDGEIEPAFIERVIHGGHYWGLRWKYPGIYHGHEDGERVVREVADVLDMWHFIESGYKRLSKKDKDRVAKEADPLGTQVAFRGFDGNNEAEHASIAQFLIRDLDRFADFKGRGLNSHMPSIETYRRMLAVFAPMRETLSGGELSVTQIIALLQASIHPQHRKPSV